jgi:apolipoprotein D and lipocalin family protein
MAVKRIYRAMACEFIERLTSAAVLWAGLAGTAFGQQAAAVPQLDLKQLAGKYYEVARLPTKADKKCVSDAIGLYALGDKPGRFQVVTSCRQKDDFTDVHISDGRRQQKNGTDGRLKLGSFWPLFSKYWVLAVGSNDEWVLVGTPNHKKLWIYSKAATMAPETLADVKARAAAQGYKVDKLVSYPQSGVVHATQ